MGGKHRNWHRAWTVSVGLSIAAHDSGLVVRFSRDPPAEPPPVGARARSADGAHWSGTVEGGAAALDSWIAAQAANGLRDQASVVRRIARLMREAGEAWTHAVDRATP